LTENRGFKPEFLNLPCVSNCTVAVKQYSTRRTSWKLVENTNCQPGFPTICQLDANKFTIFWGCQQAANRIDLSRHVMIELATKRRRKRRNFIL